MTQQTHVERPLSSQDETATPDNQVEQINNSSSPAPTTEENQQANANQYRMSKWGMLKAFIGRMLIMYFITSFFRQQKAPSTANPSSPGHPVLGPSSNIFHAGDLLDLYAYLSENKSANVKELTPLWVKSALKYGDWKSGPNGDGSYTFDKMIKTSDSLKNNGSMYLHVYIVKNGYLPYQDASQSDKQYSKKYTFHKTKKLTRQRRRQLKKTSNLLTGLSDGPEELKHNPEIHADDMKYLPPTTHWHPNLTINLVEDYTPWTRGSVPVPLNEFIEFNEVTNEYYPIIYLNDYWNLNEDYAPVNETTPELKLSITFAPMSLFKWQMYVAQNLKKAWYSQLFNGVADQSSTNATSFHQTIMNTIQSEPDWFDQDGDKILTLDEETEQDQLKKTMLETNPYLLALTVVVSLLHAVFEMLAFKNDIQFWNSRKSLEGLSAQSVLFNVFQSMVVVLYVLDNDTNFVIKVSVVVGAAIEFWKMFKVVKIRLVWHDKKDEKNKDADKKEQKNRSRLPRLQWAYEETYVKSDTQVYDKLAFKYLGCILFPLLGCYCVYSLVYQEHRGWYSWVISMLYGFLLTFGFITMTPQLFINYKLKSVAHLPWRMLTYKALNTFIDDLFAFVIKAPTLYRIGCLRDDIIFFIYLYQLWIYPTDPTRLNEFGVSKDMLDKKKEDAPQPKKELEATATVEQKDADQSVQKRALTK